MRVEVRNGDIDQALRVLKKKLTKEGVMKKIRASKEFEKPSDKKRRKAAEAKARAKKAERIRRRNS